MTIEQIGILAGIILGILTLQTTIILWSINRVEKSLNKRIDDFKQELKDLLRSEIKRLEDKITTVKL